MRLELNYMFFFFNDTATTEIYTLSLHDALPISHRRTRLDGSRTHGRAGHGPPRSSRGYLRRERSGEASGRKGARGRSEEHTSELQSRQYLVCRLLLEKKTQLHTSTSTH